MRTHCPNHIIARVSWLYGPGGNNFIEKILAAAKTRPELRVVSYPLNRGKGYAVKTGILASRGRLVLLADADGGDED